MKVKSQVEGSWRYEEKQWSLPLLLSACSSSSSSSFPSSFPESPDVDPGKPELLAGGAEPPSGELRGDAAGGQSRCRKKEVEEEQRLEEKKGMGEKKRQEEKRQRRNGQRLKTRMEVRDAQKEGHGEKGETQ